MFFECSIDDPDKIKDPDILKQNIARLKFYERYGVYRTQTLGTNSKHFFQGLWAGFFGDDKVKQKSN